ncbi:hypothetical protein FJY84_05690, partial [Candidatus Bathyarchaeota archaeon]|nr:hypothetical protein [Candidatus Bathyarchaeota archaeon]
MSLSAGLICKRGEDVTPYLLNMLLHASPITADNYGLASTKNSQYSRTLDGFSSLNSDIGIAHKLVKINPYDNDQPIQQNSNSSIILGRFWDTFDSDIITYSEIVRNGIDDGMKKILTEYDCTFSIIAAENNQLICCRDHVGNIPLYFGENERFIGAATNMKMLRLLRLKIRSIPPGSIIIIK